MLLLPDIGREKEDFIMNRRIKYAAAIFLLTFCAIALNGITGKAAMADEAEPYELGTEFHGRLEGYSGGRSFVFTIADKSYVSMSTYNGSYEERTFSYSIHSSSGEEIIKAEDVEQVYNNVEESYTGSAGRIFSPGTYYLQIDSSSFTADFSFRIQAEPPIVLPKGVITSFRSAKKGQLTVTCTPVSGALGYRIQYSTDQRLKKNVKTIYSPSASKTITGLKKGRRYYVKVCPYSVYDDGSYAFGNNSYIKTAVTKRH